jgi:hypothetical protein
VKVSGRTGFVDSCGVISAAPIENSEVEPTVAVNPADSSNVVAAWQQERFDAGGALSNVVAYSRDGGSTWAETTVPGISRCTGGMFERATDPWLSIGPDGTVYLASLVLGGDTVGVRQLLVSRSHDGGHSWAAPVVVDQSPLSDKETITADPFHAGRAYLTWTERVGPAATTGRISVTSDGGATWSRPSVIFVAPTFRIGNEIAALPDGTLIDSFVDRLQQGNETLGELVMVTSSTTGGLTWSVPQQVGTQGIPPADLEGGVVIAGASLPSNAAGRDGAAYVAWGEIEAPTASRILVARSADGGASWSAPQVAASMAAQAFQPAVDVMADGTVGVAWYDLRDDLPHDAALTTRTRLAHSHDAGRTWETATTGPPFDMRRAPVRSGEYFPGDYRETAAFPDGFGTVWTAAPPLATDGPADVFFARATVGAAQAPPSRIKLTVRPARVRVGQRRRFRLRATAAGGPAAGVRIRFAGRSVRTSRRGRATITARFRLPGRKRARASKPGLRSGSATVRVTRRP